MTTIEKIQSEYPLHWAVWNDDHKELQELIKTKKVSMQSVECSMTAKSRCVKTEDFFIFCRNKQLAYAYLLICSDIAICSNQYVPHAENGAKLCRRQ